MMSPVTTLHFRAAEITFAGNGMQAGQSEWVTIRDRRLRYGTIAITARPMPKRLEITALQMGDVFIYTEPVGFETETIAGVMLTNPGPFPIARIIVETTVSY